MLTTKPSTKNANHGIGTIRRRFQDLGKAHDDPWVDEKSPEFQRIIERLDLKRGDKVLYVGTGSGYGTSIISHRVGEAGEVYSYEIDKKAMKVAQENLRKMGNPSNVHLIIGDALDQQHRLGHFDKIIVAAGAPIDKQDPLLQHLLRQTKPDAVIIIPMGKLHTFFTTACYAETYKVENRQPHTRVSAIEKTANPWHMLLGGYGFSASEIQENRMKEGSFLDEAL